jgi:hypothetical protein
LAGPAAQPNLGLRFALVAQAAGNRGRFKMPASLLLSAITTVTSLTGRRWLPNNHTLPPRRRDPSCNKSFDSFFSYLPELPNFPPPLASESVAGDGSVYGHVASPVSVIPWIIPTEDTTKPSSVIWQFSPAKQFSVLKTAAAELATVKTSTVKTSTPEPSTVGLSSTNAERKGEGDRSDCCYHQQIAGHGIDPLFTFPVRCRHRIVGMYGCARPVCPAKTKLLNCWNS